ncbi:HNH endonuclease [Gammaproteobacteria bacterium]|nr:HNH endonuclease [Gammaproteobacteria bacterium]
MYDSARSVLPAPKTPDSLARADALEREITDLCAQINAASYRLLQLVAELDNEAPWGAWGLTSCAHWLNWRCGIGMNAAREKVRVAHALRELPQISASFATGELSFSKVRAVTRIADPENEKELLDLARHATAAQVEKLVRAYRGVERQAQREQAAVQYAARELTYYHDDDGSLVIRARLPAEEGAVVLQALNAAMDARYAEHSEAESDDVTAVTSEIPDRLANRFAQRRADALTTMAETTLRNGPEPLSPAERYQVVVHVTAETLAGDNVGRCELDNGQGLALDTVRRIACDSSLLRITEDDVGNPLDIGRKTRAVPPAMQRALRSRDGGCRFPGCTHQRFVDAHHIRHWADGGDTSIDNLVLLCRHHHRLVHEDGFGVERTANSRIRFSRPDGPVIEEHPLLPTSGSVEELLGPTHRRGNREVIDASAWIIPGGTLDYGIAIEGLMRKHDRESCGCLASR